MQQFKHSLYHHVVSITATLHLLLLMMMMMMSPTNLVACFTFSTVGSPLQHPATLALAAPTTHVQWINHHRQHHIVPSTSTTTSSTTSSTTTSTQLSANKSNNNKNIPKAEFEYQELRAQLNTMLTQKIRPNQLSNEKRQELDSYMMKLLLNKPSPIPLKALANDNAKILHGKWTLTFSSLTAALGDLPRDATVQLTFSPEYKCDYKLLFKTLGLKSITAKSSYIVDSSPVNPGLVTFVYQNIVTDVFGFKNFPVGTFGLLKGRTNYVETVWFDGRIWIERGYNTEGNEFFNVYMKDEEEEE